MPKTKKTKSVSRQLRLTTPVNAKEKQQASRLARDENKSVAELVRGLLAQRHLERRKKAIAKKARAEKKNGASKSARAGLATKSRDSLPLSRAPSTTKPSRSVGSRKSSTNRSTNRSSKNSLKSGGVSPASRTGRAAGSRTKTRASTNRRPVLR